MTSIIDGSRLGPHRSQPRPGAGLSRLRRGVPARRAARLLRVFRPARGRVRPGGARPGHPRSRSRPARKNIWRYAGLLPVGQDPATRVTLNPGFTPLVAAPGLGRRAGLHRAAVRQGRQRQPDPLVQGPGRLGRAHRRPRARLHPLRLRLHRQPGQLRRRARRPGRRAVDRLHPRRPGAGQGRHDRGVRRRPGRDRRLLRRRQPALRRAGRDRRVRGHRVRQRQRPAVLRRGFQDARVTRWPSSSAGGSRRRW